MRKKKTMRPPRPSGVPRKPGFHRGQLIGIPLLFLIPTLAIRGVFGEAHDTAQASNPDLKMQVEYTSRIGHKMLGEVTVSISNSSAQTIPILEVAFDQSYLKGFSTFDFTPSRNIITDQAYTVILEDVLPEETRAISLGIQAEKYGKNYGVITAKHKNAAAVRVEISTYVYP